MGSERSIENLHKKLVYDSLSPKIRKFTNADGVFCVWRLPGHLQGSQHQQHRGGQDESAQEESDPPQQRQ